jgi:hypothetical protein
LSDPYSPRRHEWAPVHLKQTIVAPFLRIPTLPGNP